MYWKTYTDEEGRKWAALDFGLPDEIRTPIIGPPDLSVLSVSPTDRIKIQNALVNGGIFNGDTFLNRRREIRVILKNLNLPETLEREIAGIFIQMYF